MTTITLAHGSAVYAAPERPTRYAPPSAGHLALGLERLGVVGTVLYVAAHPDDENTRLLAWLANQRGLRAVYLSLTRGDGGQNLVGAELGPLLGLIRTHELMAARAIDGAEQRFSRAIDFGYSKSAAETLGIWGQDEVLADVVRVVRELRPDVIITRFSIDPPNHGHHTASALLAREAFTVAADPARLPERGPAHRTLRIFENKSHWRFKEGEDLSRYLSIDVGGFSPLIGRSYTELAADSRTMHKSQGFGSAPAFGPQLEYFEPSIPEAWPAPMPARPEGNKDPFAGLDFTWARHAGTETLRKRIAEAQKAFSPAHPEQLLPQLAKVHAALAALPDANPDKAYKLAELEDLMLTAAGLVLDARAKAPIAIPGEPLTITATAVARLPSPAASPIRVAATFPDGSPTEPRALAFNEVDTRERSVTVVAPYSTPYWLRAPSVGGLFAPAAPLDGTQPVGPTDLSVRFSVALAGVTIERAVPVRHAWVDPVHGERFRPVEVLPPVTLTPTAEVRMFPGTPARTIDVRVRAHGAARAGEVRLAAPAGWRVAPPTRPFSLEAGGESVVAFEVTPAGTTPIDLKLEARVGEVTVDRAEAVIDHLHVPRTTILSPAIVRAIPLDLAIAGPRIGYIAGAGDAVAASLEQVGYEITPLDPAALEREDLSRFSAIIAGIRAYNVAPDLRHHHPALMRYVEGGGTYLVQYVTSTRFRPLGDMPIGPFPFTIDQGRVTDETAELRALDPAHPALITPNRLGPADFTGWVQERGLYFADTWDPRYTPLLSANDPGDKPLEGSVLVARHGKGAFVYTGLAFFRQLPEGVPGAYRLLANLLSLKGAAR